MFVLYADGFGFKRIAERLNIDGIPGKLLAAPTPQARSALRRLGARVELSFEVIDGLVNWHFAIAGTFAGLAESRSGRRREGRAVPGKRDQPGNMDDTRRRAQGRSCELDGGAGGEVYDACSHA